MTTFVEALVDLHHDLTLWLPSNSSPFTTLQLILFICVLAWLLSSKSNENLLLRHFLRKVNWYLYGIWFMVKHFKLQSVYLIMHYFVDIIQ